MTETTMLYNIKQKKDLFDYLRYFIILLSFFILILFTISVSQALVNANFHTAIFLGVMFILFIFFTFLIVIKTRKLQNELVYYRLATNKTDELIIFLDNYGTIKHCNQTLLNSLNISFDEIVEKPLRDIFYLMKLLETTNFKRFILDKLKTVFMGDEAEIISPIQIKESNKIKSLFLKLIPIMKDNEVINILCLGKILSSDYITNKWLREEQSHFELSNNFAMLNTFCHRITRNLETRFPYEQIVYIQIALHEVIINAIEHGNLEVDFHHKTELKRRGGSYLNVLLNESNHDLIKNRKINIYYSLEKDRVVYIIKDDGKGFDWQKYMDNDINIEHEHFTETMHGLGLHIVKETFDTIKYNQVGNEITLIKRFINTANP